MVWFDYKLWLKQTLGTLSLNGDNVPYFYGRYVGNSSSYVVGIMYDSRGNMFTDNQEVGTVFNIQLDVYSKVDNQSLVSDIYNKLISEGATKDHILESVDSDGTLVTNMFFKLERNVS